MIEDVGACLSAVVRLFQTELTLYGFTFSYWEIFLYLCVIGIVAFIIGGVFGGE